MDRKTHLGLILGIGLCAGLLAETINAGPAGCGQEIRMHDVLVLDVEPLRRDPEMAQDFVVERAGEFRLVDSDIEEIITRSRPSKDPDDVIRRAQKLGVKRGCDLVLVLKTGPYFGRQRSIRGRARRVKDKGYAFVVMGQRIASR